MLKQLLCPQRRFPEVSSYKVMSVRSSQEGVVGASGHPPLNLFPQRGSVDSKGDKQTGNQAGIFVGRGGHGGVSWLILLKIGYDCECQHFFWQNISHYCILQQPLTAKRGSEKKARVFDEKAII